MDAGSEFTLSGCVVREIRIWYDFAKAKFSAEARERSLRMPGAPRFVLRPRFVLLRWPDVKDHAMQNALRLVAVSGLGLILAVCAQCTGTPRPDAGTFNSTMKLDVRSWTALSITDYGTTPAAKPLVLPEDGEWGIAPLDRSVNMAALVVEMNRQHVPGLWLSRATDEDLGALQELQDLRFLYLAGTKVTDAGLARLTGLKGLQSVALDGTKVTDAGLVYLKEFKGLKTLSLNLTQVTDTGLRQLAELRGLQTLKLADTKVSDVVHLGGLRDMQYLDLSGTQVTDAGLVHVKELKSLQTLSLWKTKVSNAGLAPLKELPELRSLDLSATRVTAAGVAQLQKALPGCHIEQ